MKQVNALLERYDNFKSAQLRSIYKETESSIMVKIVVQDDDGEDTNEVKIEFLDVSSSRILDNSVLSFMDMMSGISIIKEHDLYAFSIGTCNAIVHAQSAPLYIISTGVKIEDKAL